MNDLWTPDDTGLPDGSVGRLLDAITVNTHLRVRGKDASEDKHKLKEIEQQFQFLISGVAGKTIAWEEVSIPFDYAFHFAPTQRESNLEYPHFTYGSQTNPAVGIHITVNEWLQDLSIGAITGAVVAIGAIGTETTFTGVAHLSFQGFGALIEESEEEGAE